MAEEYNRWAKGSDISNAELKDRWKTTGKGMESAARSLGGSLKKTIKKGIDDTSDSQETVTDNELKDSWKETGVGFGHAFMDLGKSFLRSSEKAAGKANDWIDK